MFGEKGTKRCHGITNYLKLTGNVLGGTRVQQQGNNQTVKTQDFGENENQNHTDKQSWLLSSTTDTSVTNNTNGETSSQTGQTNRETSTQLNETGVQGLLLFQTIRDQDGNDKTVNGDNTSHNNWDNVLNQEVWSQDGGGTDTNTRLGGTVSGTETCEDNGRSTTDRTKEWLEKTC